MPIQPREVAVMKYLDGFIKAHGCAPTQRQIAEHFSFRSKHYAGDVLKRLADMGYIRVRRHHRRGIEVVQMPSIGDNAYQVRLPAQIEEALRQYSVDCKIAPETAIMEAVRAYLGPSGVFMKRNSASSPQKLLKAFTIETTVADIAILRGLTPGEIRSKDRNHRISVVRDEIIWTLRKQGFNNSIIGKAVNRSDELVPRSVQRHEARLSALFSQ